MLYLPSRAAALACALGFFVVWAYVYPPVLEASLSGQVAVVTGGSRGSGVGFARGLSEAGATVYITGRNVESLRAACNSVPGPGPCIAKVCATSISTTRSDVSGVFLTRASHNERKVRR